MHTSINHLYDHYLRFAHRITGGRPFHWFVITGSAIGALLIPAFAWLLGVSVLSMLLSACLCLAFAYLLAKATQILTGYEQYTFYHYLLFTIAGMCLAAWLFEVPILVALDLFAIGMGTTHAIGRMGCLAAGCCHGTPAASGVCYHDKEHQHHSHRLVPIQHIESAGVALLVSIAVFLLLKSGSGTAFLFYLSSYALLRFTLEFWRGDTQKAGFIGYNEPQWISLSLAAFVLGLAIAMGFPAAIKVIAGLLLLAGLSLQGIRILLPPLWLRINRPRLRAEWQQLFHEQYRPEIQSAFRPKPTQESPQLIALPLSCIQVSRARIKAPGGMQHTMTISGLHKAPDAGLLRLLMRFWVEHYPDKLHQLIKGNHPGIWHLSTLDAAKAHQSTAIWESMAPAPRQSLHFDTPQSTAS